MKILSLTNLNKVINKRKSTNGLYLYDVFFDFFLYKIIKLKRVGVN